MIHVTGERAAASSSRPCGERLPVGVAQRLSRYLDILAEAERRGSETMASKELSEHTGIHPTQVRRDLSKFGNFGKRGVGYDIEALVLAIRAIMATSGLGNIALIGAGGLGKSILDSEAFDNHPFRVAAVFDVDPRKIGTPLSGHEVRPLEDLEAAVDEIDIAIGALAVPASAAQEIADRLVGAGVEIVFNYTAAPVQAPADVTVHTADPAVEMLHALYFYKST